MPLEGLSGLASIGPLEEDNPFATAEERSGGLADPRHGHWGEQAAPYPWESSLALGGSHGPYGPENQMLGDDDIWSFPGGLNQDYPGFDRNQPYFNRKMGHGSVNNVTISGPVPSQYDAICHQLEQSIDNHASDLGSGQGMLTQRDALQDDWKEIWEVNPGFSSLEKAPAQIVISSGGWGTTDRTQSLTAQNEYGFDSKHQHRRYATGSIPGNYMWLKPGGRPMHKTLAGPARPATGQNSPFYGQDLGEAFSYDGAILQDQPTEYQTPPSPYVAPNAVQDSPGEVDWW